LADGRGGRTTADAMGAFCTKPTVTSDECGGERTSLGLEDVEKEGEGGQTEALFRGVGTKTFSAEMAEKWLRGERSPSEDEISVEELDDKVNELDRFATARFYALGVDEDVGRAVDEMRRELRKRKLDDNRLGDDEMRRFYVGRGRVVQDAIEYVAEILEWRQKHQPNGHFEFEEFETEYRRNKVAFLGYDRLGRACLLVRAKMHDGSLYKLKTDEATKTFSKYVIHVFDSVIAATDRKGLSDRFVMVVDLQDSNKALVKGATIETLLYLAKFFPERLGAVWVLNGKRYPSVRTRVMQKITPLSTRTDHKHSVILSYEAPMRFWALYKIVSPFLTKQQKQKILFVSQGDAKKMLSEHISMSYLPVEYGGELDLSFHGDFAHPLMEEPNPPYYLPICQQDD